MSGVVLQLARQDLCHPQHKVFIINVTQRTNSGAHRGIRLMMSPPQFPNSSSPYRVIEVERTSDGVVVTFDDGLTAVYDGDWLRQQIAHAKLVLEADDDTLPVNR